MSAVALVLFGDGGRVLLGGVHVVHRAGAHDHQQALIVAPQNRLDPLARLTHRGGCGLAQGQLLMQERRCHERPRFHHVEIRGGNHAGSRTGAGG